MARILYLHGFASSPHSRKARYFHNVFAKHGMPLEILDLAQGNFEGLTISGQLRVIEEAANGEPVSLIGSSLGGYLAALYASQHPEVETVALLAPAFQFAARWQDRIGPQAIEQWRTTGTLEVFHYGENRAARIGYGLIEDGLRHPPEPSFSQPGLLFHGLKDDVCPVEISVRYAARHPQVRMQTFDAGHELTEVLDAMWPPIVRLMTFL